MTEAEAESKSVPQKEETSPLLEAPVKEEVPPAPAEAADPSDGAGWKQVLGALKGKVDDPTYIMLSDSDAYEGERQGARLIVRCGNPFARIMADTQEIQTALKKAAEAVFGQPTPVILADRGETVPELPEEKKADKLDELAAFDIVRFK